jgi:hypothetical protein
VNDPTPEKLIATEQLIATPRSARPTKPRAIRKIARAEEELAKRREAFDKQTARIEAKVMNRDPITGAPGSHGVGTAIGTTGGVAAGAALGSLAGPMGTAVGGLVGAIVGAAAGHSVGEAINPTAEETYWRDVYVGEPRYSKNLRYEDYALASGRGTKPKPNSSPSGSVTTAIRRSHGRKCAMRRTRPGCTPTATTPSPRPEEGAAMPRGDKSSYTDKQKRQAEHIEEGERKQGRPEQDAERIAWATVNKQDGGGKKKAATKTSAAKKSAAKKAPGKSAAGKSGSTR